MFSPAQRRNNTLIHWFALWMMVCMLGQSLLPTLVYARSASRPGLWNEICSVYGARSISTKISTELPDTPPTNSHAECPLCLQILHDVIPDQPAPRAQIQIILFRILHADSIPALLATADVFVAQARGPPEVS